MRNDEITVCRPDSSLSDRHARRAFHTSCLCYTSTVFQNQPSKGERESESDAAQEDPDAALNRLLAEHKGM